MFFSITILAFSLSLDALGVGIVYGLRRIKIPLIPKLVISFFSILYSGLSLGIGSSLAKKFPGSVSKLFGVAILIILGIWYITQAWFRKANNPIPESISAKKNILISEAKTLCKLVIKSLGITIHVIRNPVEFDIDKSGSIDIKESVLLGLALSLDAIGVGIGSGMIGFHSSLIPFLVGLFQFIFLYVGANCGEKFALSLKANERLLSFLPGILLIILAIIRIY